MEGGNKMRYSKPQVVVLPCATEAIQGSMKGSNVIQDNPTFLTMNAYEADE